MFIWITALRFDPYCVPALVCLMFAGGTDGVPVEVALERLAAEEAVVPPVGVGAAVMGGALAEVGSLPEPGFGAELAAIDDDVAETVSSQDEGADAEADGSEEGETDSEETDEEREEPTTWVSCDFSDVRFSAEFPQGRFGRCERGEDGRLILHLEPESMPINPSPWHAFTIESDEPRTIEIEIRSEHARTRYRPKISLDRTSWDVMDFESEGSSQFFTVEVGPEKVWIAGQELFDNNDYQVWLAQLEERYEHLQRIQLGRSEEDRELPALVHYGSGDEWLLLLGRQHPPEITGAMAMRTFVEALLDTPVFSEAFLDRYNVLIAPNLNPDGVAGGHWRHNANGVDLNRDWFSLEQAETQAVDAFIRELLNEGGELVYGVDFHSTFRDVYYTTPGDYLDKEPDFSFDWLNMLAAAVAPNPVREIPAANPAQGNFKQYMADTHGTHAVTYEVADDSDRMLIDLIATHAARTLMAYMLVRPLPDEAD